MKLITINSWYKKSDGIENTLQNLIVLSFIKHQNLMHVNLDDFQFA